MTIFEFIVSYIPLFIIIVIMLLVIRKAGGFQQREHRLKIEQLLERIAIAVEKSEHK
jgi:hypothetical protein